MTSRGPRRDRNAHVHPTRRLAAWLAGGLLPAALPALFDAPALWIVPAAYTTALAVLALFDLALLCRVPAASLRVEAPDLLAVGRPADVAVHVAPPGALRPTPLHVRLELEGPAAQVVTGDADPADAADGGADPVARGTPVGPDTGDRGGMELDGVLMPGGGLELRGTIRADRRGKVRVRAVWTSVRGPLGLVRRVARATASTSMAVAPDHLGVRDHALRFLAAREAQGGIKTVRFIGDGTEFEALREFAPGFDSRTIDWRASARHRRLFRREFRAEQNQPVVVAIDSGRLMDEPIDGLTRLDRSIHAGLALGLVAAKTGDRVGLYSFDARPRLYLEPAAGVAAWRRMQFASADIDGATEETNFTLGLLDLLRRLKRRSLVVLFTDFADSISAELLVENIGRLARRHLVLFVTLKDPLLDRVRFGRPTSAAAVHRAVIADELEHEREEVLLRLRRLGVLCIDAPWQSVTTDLLNRYVDVKRRERVG